MVRIHVGQPVCSRKMRHPEQLTQIPPKSAWGNTKDPKRAAQRCPYVSEMVRADGLLELSIHAHGPTRLRHDLVRKRAATPAGSRLLVSDLGEWVRRSLLHHPVDPRCVDADLCICKFDGACGIGLGFAYSAPSQHIVGFLDFIHCVCYPRELQLDGLPDVGRSDAAI